MSRHVSTPRQVDAMKRLDEPRRQLEGQRSSTRMRTSPERPRSGPDGTTVAVTIPPRRARYVNYTLHDQFLRYMADPTVREDVDPLTVRLRTAVQLRSSAREETLRCDFVRIFARVQGAWRQAADVARPVRCRHPRLRRRSGILPERGEADGRPRARRRTSSGCF